jgi:hypothetical protein
MMSKQIALPMSNDEERDPPHRGLPAEHTAVPYVKADLKFLKKAGLNFPSPSVRTGL